MRRRLLALVAAMAGLALGLPLASALPAYAVTGSPASAMFSGPTETAISLGSATCVSLCSKSPWAGVSVYMFQSSASVTVQYGLTSANATAYSQGLSSPSGWWVEAVVTDPYSGDQDGPSMAFGTCTGMWSGSCTHPTGYGVIGNSGVNKDWFLWPYSSSGGTSGPFTSASGLAGGGAEYLGIQDGTCGSGGCQEQVEAIAITMPAVGSSPVLTTSAPSVTCADTLTNSGSGYATLTGTTSGANVASWAYSWSPGDGSSALTTNPATHTYTPSAEPAGGWTATLSATATAASGYQFPNSSTTDTVTCTVTISFAAQSENSGSGASSSPTSIGDCEPSGWNWLNPVALVQGTFCLLQVLFVPSSATISQVQATWTTTQTKAPFSFFVDVASFLPTEANSLNTGIASGIALSTCPNLFDISNSAGGGDHNFTATGGQNTNALGSGTATYNPLAGMSARDASGKCYLDDMGGGTSGAWSFMRYLILIGILFAVALAVFKTTQRVLS